MHRRCSLVLVIMGTLLGTTWLLQGHSSNADDETKSARKASDDKKPGVKTKLLRAFMRKKLAASQSVLEGLVVEDFQLIADGAKQLEITATGAEFMVSKDPTYLEHANRFRRIVKKLAGEAREKRLEGATLAYLDMTMRCVECHAHVRDMPIER